MDYLDAIVAVSEFFQFDSNKFLGYVQEDTIGGYSPVPEERTFNGPWTVEMQFLYGLVRMFRPRHVLEVGNAWGNSTSHICAALRANQKGKLTSVDIKGTIFEEGNDKQFLDVATFEVMDVFDFDFAAHPDIDFVFDDSTKRTKMVAHVWGNFFEYGKPGGVIVGHDSEHWMIGERMRSGVEQVIPEGEYLSLLIEPADCGLAMWRKP